MPQIDRKTLEAQLRKGELSNFYYIFGQDVRAVEALTAKIIKAAVGDNEDFALNKLSGKNLNLSEFRDMAEMVPMMTEYNCILVNDFNCEEQREDVIKQLTEVLKDIPSKTVIIFNVTGFEVKTKIDWKSRKNTITDKNKKIADIAAKSGVLTELPLKTPAELAKDISASVSARGSMISLDNARELAEMCLCDSLVIKNEIDKLCVYAQGKEITSQMLDELVHRRSSVTIFNLADAVASFNKKAAFDALDELMADKNNRGAILANITNSFLDLYRVQCARQSGHTAEEVKQDFAYFSRGFAIEKLYRNGVRISLKRLRECIKILRDTAVQLNSTSADEKIVLEQTVTKMLMTKNQ